MQQLAQNEQVVMATRISPEACHCSMLNRPGPQCAWSKSLNGRNRPIHTDFSWSYT